MKANNVLADFCRTRSDSGGMSDEETDRPRISIPRSVESNPLTDLIEDFMRSDQADALSNIVHSFLRFASGAGFKSEETATMLKGYLKLGDESPLYYLEDSDLKELFGFLGKLKETPLWDEEETMKFQMMFLEDPAKSGILEVFKSHRMYRHITSEEKPTTFQNTYYLEQNDNNAPQFVKATRRPSKSDYEEYDDVMDFSIARRPGSGERPNMESILNKAVSKSKPQMEIFTSVVYDMEEIGQMEHERTTYVVNMDVSSGEVFNLDGVFHYLRCFRVDTKCTVILSIGLIDEPHSWAKDIVAKPGAWYNFSDRLLPHQVNIKMVAKNEHDEDEKINIRIMGMYMQSGEMKDPPEPSEYGFRPYFTLLQ